MFLFFESVFFERVILESVFFESVVFESVFECLMCLNAAPMVGDWVQGLSFSQPASSQAKRF